MVEVSRLPQAVVGLIEPIPTEATPLVVADLLIQRLLAAEELAMAAAVDEISRAGCGQNVNDLICAGPLDGTEQEAACPKCGLLLTWRAPRFDSDTETVAV